MDTQLHGTADTPSLARQRIHRGDPDAASQLPHAPLMKVLGLPPATNPDVVRAVLRRIAEDGPHRAVGLVRQSALMALLPAGRDPATLAASLVRLARMSRIETVMQALRR